MARPTSSHYTHRHRSLHGRRTDRTLLCSDLVRIRWCCGAERREEIAILEDMSPSGASLFTGVSLPEGTALTLSARDRQFEGKVHGCAATVNGYLLKIKASGVPEWRGAAGCGYTPEHLLDVSRLDFSAE